jgi:ParB family chromosome partitioning protein
MVVKHKGPLAADFLASINNNQNATATAAAPTTMSGGTLSYMAGKTMDDEQQKVRSVRLESGVSYITLKSGRRVKFISVYVAADDLEDYTRVHPYNTRNQDVLKEEYIDDILPSIKTSGVMLPAKATRNPDDKTYEIFDGSRRRFGALIAHQGLQIDYTDEELSDVEILELSHVTNLTKASSLHDQGRYYQSMIDAEPGMSMKKLSVKEGIPISTISYAIYAYKIPKAIYQMYPSNTELGRPSILAIKSIIEGLTAEQMSLVLEECGECRVLDTNKEAELALRQIVAAHTGAANGEKKPSSIKTEIGSLKIEVKKNKLIIDTPDDFDVDAFHEFLRSWPALKSDD